MLRQLFDMNNILWRLIDTIVDFVILNLLFLICSLPIITIGASATALYTITIKKVRNEEGYLFKGFLKAFKENFKQSTVLWSIMLIIGIIIAADIYFTEKSSDSAMQTLYNFFVFLGFLYIMVLSYVFPVQSKFINPVKKTLKNSLVMSIAHLFPWTVLIVLINLLPVLSFYFVEDIAGKLIPLMLMGGFSTIAYVNSLIFNRIFKRYIPKAETVAE